MNNFSYHNPARIIFGRDTIAEVGHYTAQYAKKVLLHYGSGSIRKNGIYDTVTSSLKQHGIEFIELSGVVPNPRLSLVKEGIELCRREGITFILAVGGGSVIDSAKAIAFGSLLNEDEDIWDDYYMNKNCVVTRSLDVGVVLTIPAAGSESSISTVITNDTNDLKRAVNQEALTPRFAIMDPQTNYSLPDYQSACGAADILAHLMERYFTNSRYNNLSDAFLEAAMRNVISFAPLVLIEPSEYRYRAELMWTGTIAHNGLLDRGRVGDWASHAIEHELSGIYDIAHGAGLAIVFPAWMKYVYHHDIDRFVQWATRVWNISVSHDDKETVVLLAIRALEEFFRSLTLPIRLSDAGIGTQDIPRMAANLMKGSDGTGNFVHLGQHDVEQILRLAL